MRPAIASTRAFDLLPLRPTNSAVPSSPCQGRVDAAPACLQTRLPDGDIDSDDCSESGADSAAVILNEGCYDPLTVTLVFMKVPLPPEYIGAGSGAGVGLVFIAGDVTSNLAAKVLPLSKTAFPPVFVFCAF